MVTLEILLVSLKMIVIRDEKSVMTDEHFAAVEEAREGSFPTAEEWVRIAEELGPNARYGA